MRNVVQQKSQNLSNSPSRLIQMPLVKNQYPMQEAKLPQNNPQQPQIEVTQMKMNQSQFPFALPPLNYQHSQHIVQGVPISQLQELADRQKQNSAEYSDNFRLHKYELEKEINSYLVGFIRQNKISLILMVILVISYIVQIATHNSNEKETKHQGQNKGKQQESQSNFSNYLFWLCACIAALKSQQTYNLRYMNMYLGLMIFSIIPQILGYADLAVRNHQSNETTIMIINIIACVIEFIYKAFIGIIKGYSIRVLYAKHTSQYQGQQVLLLNNQQKLNRV